MGVSIQRVLVPADIVTSVVDADDIVLVQAIADENNIVEFLCSIFFFIAFERLPK
jgi:hypothetical protein